MQDEGIGVDLRHVQAAVAIDHAYGQRAMKALARFSINTLTL